MATLIRSLGGVRLGPPNAEADTTAGASAAEDFKNVRREIVIEIISLSWNPGQDASYKEKPNRLDGPMQKQSLNIRQKMEANVDAKTKNATHRRFDNHPTMKNARG